MTPKQRLLTALQRGKPDRLPVTTHHLMQYFPDKYMGGISSQEFFEHFGLDAITWPVLHKPDPAKRDYFDPLQGAPGFLEARRIWSDQWRIEAEDVPGEPGKTTRYRFVTPRGTLSMVTQSNEHTTWVTEYLIKNKRDIDLIGAYVTSPVCDVEAVNQVAQEYGQRGIVRSHIPCFDVFGQPGTWQDACCLYPTEQLILATTTQPGCTIFSASCSGARRCISDPWSARSSISWNWAAARLRALSFHPGFSRGSLRPTTRN